LKELVTGSGAKLAVASLSVVLFAICVAFGAAKKKLKAGMVGGFILGALNLIMWSVYNAIVRITGLDSFWGLVVQMVLFTLLGAAIGYCAARYGRLKS
jgi:uncharacterized membrane protein YkvI